MNTDPHYTIFSTSPLRHLSLTSTNVILCTKLQGSTLKVKYFCATSREQTDSTMHYVARVPLLLPSKRAAPKQ